MTSGRIIAVDYNPADMLPHVSPVFPLASEVVFGEFNNRFAGESCYIIGRGPTRFDFEALAEVSEPIFFINDAVSLEKFARSKTFFFAHDAQLLAWLNGAIRSTAVLPIDGKIFKTNPGIMLNHAGAIVFYHWREKQKEELLQMDRNQLAIARQLYTHTGTIHSVLHFVWYCGFRKVNFIGCDGLMAVDYDSRIANRSNSIPIGNYAAIAHVQRLLCQLFNLESTYLGTPEDLSRVGQAYNVEHGKEESGGTEKL